MRVLFVHSEEDPPSVEKPVLVQERVQFGISYISAMLRREGHLTSLAVLTREDPEVLLREVESFDPGLVCFTGVYTEYLFLREVVRSLKRKRPDLFTVLGGPHATLRPLDCARESDFDAVCVGEGEFPALELVEQLEAGKYPSNIPNLVIKRPDGSLEVNPPRPFLEDLDTLPFPDRDMWRRWLAIPDSRPSVLVGRGCPFACTYCSNHAIRRAAPGKYVRLRDPAKVVEELRDLKMRQPNVGEVYLEVETLGVDIDWALELCEKLKDFNKELETPIFFGSNLRITPGRDYSRLFQALAECNFKFINMGLESGSERIRREVLKRNYSNRDFIKAVRTAREFGLQVGIYNLVGLPTETRREFMETVKVNRICQPDWFLLSVFFPYPGTELYETCKELGLLKGPLDHELERRKPVLDLPGFSKLEIAACRTLFPLMVYGGHRPLREVLWLVTMAQVYSDKRLIRLYQRWEGLRRRARRSRGKVEEEKGPA